MLTIEIITLLGVILIGLGLALQGWFILDMNKRFSKLMGKLLLAINEDGE
jgi:hypothetical protein|tara:strand:- start:1626 stop:1775 length:150 start_codon:yes stop_codon:yes gene_type:complete